MLAIRRTSSIVVGFSILLNILHECDSYYVPVGQGGIAKQAIRTLEEVKNAVRELKQLCDTLSVLIHINRRNLNIGGRKTDTNSRIYQQLCQNTPKWKKFNSLLNYD